MRQVIRECETPEQEVCITNNKENLSAEPHYEFCQKHSFNIMLQILIERSVLPVDDQLPGVHTN